MSGGILEDFYDSFISEGAEPVGYLGANKAFLVIGEPSDVRNWQREEFLERVMPNNVGDVHSFLNRYSISDVYDNMFYITTSEKMPRANINANGGVDIVFREVNDIKTEVGSRKGANEDFLQATHTLTFILAKGIGDQVVPNGNEISIEAFKSRNLGFTWDLWRDPNCIKGNVIQLWTEDTRGFMRNPRASVYLLLSLRKPQTTNAVGWTERPCLENPTPCPEIVYPSECPCPQLGVPCVGATMSNLVFPVEPAQPGISGPISIKTSADTIVSGTVVTVNADGSRVEIDFGAGVEPSNIPDFYQEILCQPFGECRAEVLFTKNCIEGDDLVVATVYCKLVELADGDALLARHCDETQTPVVYSAADSDLALNAYGLTATDLDQLLCEHGEICELCVVPTVANGCPDCESPDCVPCA